jgi:hypothetical protein
LVNIRIVVIGIRIIRGTGYRRIVIIVVSIITSGSIVVVIRISVITGRIISVGIRINVRVVSPTTRYIVVSISRCTVISISITIGVVTSIIIG